VAVAFDVEGEPLDEGDGPLRVVVLGPSANQITEGHLWVKDLVRLRLVEREPDWMLHLSGAREEEISRSFFEAGAAPDCHMARWVDEEGVPWTGLPLWILVGWVDDDNVHETGAFNRSLAAQGYDIDLVAAGGERFTLSSDRVSLDNGIILANRRDGEPLTGEDAPLRLVGDGVEESERFGGVVEIILHVE
jgi:hypothetical protein